MLYSIAGSIKEVYSTRIPLLLLFMFLGLDKSSTAHRKIRNEKGDILEGVGWDAWNPR